MSRRTGKTKAFCGVGDRPELTKGRWTKPGWGYLRENTAITVHLFVPGIKRRFVNDQYIVGKGKLFPSERSAPRYSYSRRKIKYSRVQDLHPPSDTAVASEGGGGEDHVPTCWALEPSAVEHLSGEKRHRTGC